MSIPEISRTNLDECINAMAQMRDEKLEIIHLISESHKELWWNNAKKIMVNTALVIAEIVSVLALGLLAGAMSVLTIYPLTYLFPFSPAIYIPFVLVSSTVSTYAIAFFTEFLGAKIDRFFRDLRNKNYIYYSTNVRNLENQIDSDTLRYGLRPLVAVPGMPLVWNGINPLQSGSILKTEKMRFECFKNTEFLKHAAYLCTVLDINTDPRRLMEFMRDDTTHIKVQQRMQNIKEIDRVLSDRRLFAQPMPADLSNLIGEYT